MTTTHDHPSTSTTTGTSYLRAWPDDVVARLGWPVHSAYTECCLTTVLGPISTLLLRQLVRPPHRGSAGSAPREPRGDRAEPGPWRRHQPQQQARAGAHPVGQFGYLKAFGGALPGFWMPDPCRSTQRTPAGPGRSPGAPASRAVHGSEDGSVTP